MDIFRQLLLPSWRNPTYSGSTGPNPFTAGTREPDWCTPVLFRAWDCHSYTQLSFLDDGNIDPQGKGFQLPLSEDHEAFEQIFETCDKRVVALKAHATYKDYDACFISMQMDWHALIERGRRLHTRRKRTGYTYITAIDAKKLAQKKWTLLRMADELKAANIQLDGYVAGEPWYHRWYQDEVLAISQIPQDCIIGSFELEEKENWWMGAEKWRDEILIPKLKQRLGLTTLPKWPSPELFKTSWHI